MIDFAARVLRGAIAAFVGLLFAGGTLTLAADRAAVQRPTLVPVAAGPKTLTVPQVTGQAYVFAKGILQDSGFAWHVSGAVRGFAGNTVAGQEPSPGTVVLDTGAPKVTLTLRRNRAYAELGTPEDDAPYAWTAVQMPANPLARQETAPGLAPGSAPAPSAKMPTDRKPTADRRSSASSTRQPAASG